MDKITSWIIVSAIVLVIAGGLFFYLDSTEINEINVEKYCDGMSISEGINIASSFCFNGTLKDSYACNNYTHTLWISFEPEVKNPTCNPACVVDIVNKSAEINWRCTGLIPPSG